ncbi:hypothetical protein MN608_08047 [Microdochium nivale]|nr:hypothetical protein MN608_08047 [Microdochium nivale]
MPPPPPATPTPNRFLIPRKNNTGGSGSKGTALGSSQRPQPPKQQQQPQHETPRSSLPGILPGSQQQFNATPRFSLHSTPRLSQQRQHPPSTPAAAAAATAHPPSSLYFRQPLRTKNAAAGGGGVPGSFDDDLLVDSSPPQRGDELFEYAEGDNGEDQLLLDERVDAVDHARVFGVRGHSRDDVLESIVTESSPPTGYTDDNDYGKHARDADARIGDGSDDFVLADAASPRSPKRRRISISSLPPFDDDEREATLPPLLAGDDIDAPREDEEVEQRDDESQSGNNHGDDDGHMDGEEMDIEPNNGPVGHEVRQQDILRETEADENAAIYDAPQTTTTHQHQQPQPQQPKFHRAPRFKQRDQDTTSTYPGSEQHERHYDPLPEMFSPSRRGNRGGGSKYVPGGLASELRDWLVDMEAATGSKREGDWLARIVVDGLATTSAAARLAGAASAPGGMRLVHGHHISASVAAEDNNTKSTRHEHDGTGDVGMAYYEAAATAAVDSDVLDMDKDDAQEHRQDGDSVTRVKIILAGEGRITPGIAKRKPIKPGVIVGIARPTWEITLGPELGVWAVACDWALLD